MERVNGYYLRIIELIDKRSAHFSDLHAKPFTVQDVDCIGCTRLACRPQIIASVCNTLYVWLC